MATAFPGGLDSFLNPAGTDLLDNATAGLKHATQHDNINDAVAALETKVGITNSADTSSLDYKVRNVLPTDGSIAVKRSATSIATMSPMLATGTVSFQVGQVYFTFFTAPLSLTTTQVRYVVTTQATTSAAGTGIGLYSVDASDNGTLIASVASTSLFTTSGTRTASWAASAAITAGNRYAIGFLDIVGSGQPFLAGLPLGNTQLVNLTQEYTIAPRVTGVWTQSSMPASFTPTNLNSSNPQNPIYAVIL